MTKAITFLQQACWLLQQVIGRASQRLAVTTPELGAVAIGVCTTAYILLLAPKASGCPDVISDTGVDMYPQYLTRSCRECRKARYPYSSGLYRQRRAILGAGISCMGAFNLAQGSKRRALFLEFVMIAFQD